MKKAKRVLLLALCAVLLVGATIAGTVAYLTSQTEVVKNTFTAGNVTIELKEKEMTPETGELVADGGLVDAIDEIKIVPNRTIFKQPVVIVKDGSEDCWLFVKVEGELLTGGSFAVNKNWKTMTFWAVCPLRAACCGAPPRRFPRPIWIRPSPS